MKGLKEMKWYCCGVSTSPKWPLAPPPKVEGTEAAFACSCFFRVVRLSYVGCPVIRSSVWCAKRSLYEDVVEFMLKSLSYVDAANKVIN